MMVSHTVLLNFLSWTERKGVSDDGPKSSCSFVFFGQLSATSVSQDLMKELEDEIDNPTGIATVSRPPSIMNGILLSKNCGILYEFPEVTGLK